MKRQHPTDPNLFWCPKCNDFTQVRGGRRGKDCVICRRTRSKEWREKNRIKMKQARDRWRIENHDHQAQLTKEWGVKNRERRNKLARLVYANHSDTLSDKYMKHYLRIKGIRITTENMELKREQLTLFREIKQLKGEIANGTT